MISGLADKSALSGHTGKYEISFYFRNGRLLFASTGHRPFKEFPRCNCRTGFIVMLLLKIFRDRIYFYKIREAEY